jgi:asparagine synthase (glutamine-hydrolysing)
VFRFIAALWDPESATQATAALDFEYRLNSTGLDWQAAFGADGVRIWRLTTSRDSSRAVPLAAGAGVVLGTLFRREGEHQPSRPLATLSEPESRTIVASGGRALVDRYWGKYVAILVDRDRRRRWVLRDPAATLSCLYISWNGLRLYFSALQSLSFLREIRFSPFREYLITSLSRPVLDTTETCVADVYRLVGGQCHELADSGDIRVHQYWSPLSFVREGVIRDSAIANAKVRAATACVVQSWASCHRAVLHTLSGGLDSSIVLSCLREVMPAEAIMCANAYYRRASNTDERMFARMVAERKGVKLIEYEPTAEFDARNALRPFLAADWRDRLGQAAWARDLECLARESAVDAVYSGSGGDEIFLRSGPAYAFADALRLHGLTGKAINAAWHSARLTGGSVWRVLYRGFRDGVLRDPFKVIFGRPVSSPFLTRDAAHEVAPTTRFTNPWIEKTGRIPLGKLFQISLLAVTRGGDNVLYVEADPERVMPLVSQPLMEVCLRIETPILAGNGWDRVVARHAFESDLPPDVVWRRSKSYLSEFFNHLIEFNHAIVRETLLDGDLVKERIIDPNVVERMLADPFHRSLGHGMDLCALFSLEAWMLSLRKHAYPGGVFKRSAA